MFSVVFRNLLAYNQIMYFRKIACPKKYRFSHYSTYYKQNKKKPTNVSSYSCSCYLNIDAMHIYAKFPRENKAIARGTIQKEIGPIDINENTSHVDLYLFAGIDPSGKFEVVEKWENNG